MKKKLIIMLILLSLGMMGCLEPTTLEEKESSLIEQKRLDPDGVAIVPLIKL